MIFGYKITQNIRNMQENYDFCYIFYDFSCIYGFFIVLLHSDCNNNHY